MRPHEKALIADAVCFDWLCSDMVWGQRDCAHLIMDMRSRVGAPITFKGLVNYKTSRGGWRALRSLGYHSVMSACDELLGERLETPLFAEPGDVLLVPSDSPWDGGLSLVMSGHRCLLVGSDPENDEPPRFHALGHVDPVTGVSMALAAWRLV